MNSCFKTKQNKTFIGILKSKTALLKIEGDKRNAGAIVRDCEATVAPSWPQHPYLWRRQLIHQQSIYGGTQQLLPQDLSQMLCQGLLLLPGAVVLQRQDEGVV